MTSWFVKAQDKFISHSIIILTGEKGTIERYILTLALCFSDFFETWFDDRHCYTLSFDTSWNDCDLHSRSQGCKQVRRPAIILVSSEDLQSFCQLKTCNLSVMK